jgi:D-glycero-alpha-D-manno-heptose 1-phosphate guanylyltransferase
VVEASPLGTGGAVRLALDCCEKDHVFVFNGDTFLDLDMASVERHWQRNGHSIIVGRHVPDAGRYGRLLVEGGRVVGFAEKGDTGAGLINAGCYVFARDHLNAWPLGQPFSLESDHLVRAVGQEPVDLFEAQGLFIDIGVPADFERAPCFLIGMA